MPPFALAAYTDATLRAIENLRDPSHFQWYLIPLFAFVNYVYYVEVERKNWNVVLAGLAVYGLEWLLEILNGLWLHVSGYAAVWTTPGGTAYLITVGLNIEISMMFAVMGVAFAKILPPDRSLKILGIPNRWFLILTNSIFCVAIEVVLNAWGALVWEYRWWCFPHVYLIVLIGYAPYFVFSFWVHDTPSMKAKVAAVGTVWALVFAGLAVFMGWLGWI